MSDAVNTIAVATGALTGAAAVITYGVMHPRSRLLAPVVYRVAGDAVALTFDDGPHPEATPAILEMLHEHGVRAAFAVIGVNAARWPGVVKQVHEAGHLVMNHTYDHSHVGVWRGVGYWVDQLRRTNDLIERITGERPRYFRPPVGLKTPLVAVAARREGMRMVTWSRRGRDGVNTTAERIVERLAEPVRGGDIVTLHDGVDPHGRREVGATIAALGPILQRWRERGVVLERLDWVIERGAGGARGEPRG